MSSEIPVGKQSEQRPAGNENRQERSIFLNAEQQHCANSRGEIHRAWPSADETGMHAVNVMTEELESIIRIIFGDGSHAPAHRPEQQISDERKDDSKVVGKVIKIGARLSIGKMAQAAVDYSSKHVDKTKQQQVMAGDYPTVSNTEFCSVASSTEFCSTASNTGNCSVSNNMGTCSVASNTGNHSVANNTGFRSAAGTTGFRSAASNAGDYSVASSIGNRSTAEVSGNQSVAIAMGKDSKARGAKGCWIRKM